MNVSKNFFHFYTYLLLSVSILILASCKGVTNSPPVEDSLDPVDSAYLITGAENSIITVNKSNQAYFSIEFSNIDNNNHISNGVREGWCIDWQKPIDSNGGSYEDIKLYSTFNVPEWNALNYLLNVKDQLKADDSSITFKEIQVAIWSLRGLPTFNLDEVDLNDLPDRMHQNGQPAFDTNKVEQILELVEAGHKDFDFTEGTKYAIIAETPVDVQTVITVVE